MTGSRALVMLSGGMLIAMACTSPVPTESPAQVATPTPQSSPSESATLEPTPTSLFPAFVMGLPVHTVAEMSALAAAGRLDGRFAAVGGYWAQFGIPCPFLAHLPTISGFCAGVQFADDSQTATTFNGNINALGVPIRMPETSNGGFLGAVPGPVTFIVHRSDSRAAQCPVGERAGCAKQLVIDAVTLSDGQDRPLTTPDFGGGPGPYHLTLDDVLAAIGPGLTPVLASPMQAGAMNDVDPRFAGDGSGLVWYVRVIAGAADVDGTAPGEDILIDDASGAVVTSLPLQVDAAYNPARVVLDARHRNPGSFPGADFAITAGERVIAKGRLDSSTSPLSLAPGDYTVRARFETGAITSPPGGPACDLPLSLAAGDDVAFYADWAGNGCTWKAGSLFP